MIDKERTEERKDGTDIGLKNRTLKNELFCIVLTERMTQVTVLYIIHNYTV